MSVRRAAPRRSIRICSRMLRSRLRRSHGKPRGECATGLGTVARRAQYVMVRLHQLTLTSLRSGKLFELQRSGSAAVSRSSGAVASGSTSPSRQERKRKTRADSPGASQGALTPAGAVGESARGSRAASRRASARLGGGAESPVVIDSDGDDCYSPSSSRGPAKRQAGASRSPVKNVALYNGNPSRELRCAAFPAASS